MSYLSFLTDVYCVTATTMLKNATPRQVNANVKIILPAKIVKNVNLVSMVMLQTARKMTASHVHVCLEVSAFI